MALLKTAAEIQTFLLTDANFNPDTIIPFIPLAEKEIIRVLGQVQYTELLDYYESESQGIPELDNLLPMVQRPLVFFAFLQGMDILNVVITNNGIGVVSTTNLVPASEKRTQALKDNITDNAWDNMEALLSFLESNIADYPNWESSSAFAYQYEYLISSAVKFNEFVPIDRSRVTFLNLRPTMADVEYLKIIPAIGGNLADQIKAQIKSNSLSAENLAILPDLQRCLAYFTYSEVYEQKKYELKAEAFLMKVVSVLDADPDSYPLYRDSGIYIADRENYQMFENDEDSNLAMFT